MNTKTDKNPPPGLKNPIPAATSKLTIKEQRKQRRDAFYKLNVDLTKSIKSMMKDLEAEKAEEILTAYMSLLAHDASESEDGTINIDIETLKQMAMFAGVSLSRIIVERYK